ncbi:hypothetical protein HNV12_01475 [Methanococcoides sp. SA1]|nr:hypothetical protein [Methanococcoides sp. SA1]
MVKCDYITVCENENGPCTYKETNLEGCPEYQGLEKAEMIESMVSIHKSTKGLKEIFGVKTY